MNLMSSRIPAFEHSEGMQFNPTKIEKKTMDDEFEVGTKAGAAAFVGMCSKK